MGSSRSVRLLPWFSTNARPPAGRTTLYDLLVTELCPQRRHFQTHSGEIQEAKGQNQAPKGELGMQTGFGGPFTEICVL